MAVLHFCLADAETRSALRLVRSVELQILGSPESYYAHKFAVRESDGLLCIGFTHVTGEYTTSNMIHMFDLNQQGRLVGCAVLPGALKRIWMTKRGRFLVTLFRQRVIYELLC